MIQDKLIEGREMSDDEKIEKLKKILSNPGVGCRGKWLCKDCPVVDLTCKESAAIELEKLIKKRGVK